MQATWIPHGAYWCSPFAKWQGSLSHLHSVRFAAHLARNALSARGIAPQVIDYGVLGHTVPQPQCFYGLPWLTGMMGLGEIGGPTIAQACATSAAVIAHASDRIGTGASSCVLAVTADRTSNAPHLYYPDPRGPGGRGECEDWMLKNISEDPLVGCDMTTTAENCAAKWGIPTAEQHAVALRRRQQYDDALRDGAAFQRRYMQLPFPVPDAGFARTLAMLDGDEGIHPTTAEGLARLRPVKPGGTVTYGGQTHPADGAAGMLITTADMARELSADRTIGIRIAGHGLARTDPGYMPAATVPAARRALAMAGIGIDRVAAVKTHNPFAVNDCVFARETGFDVMRMNNYGCSLIWGHPQGATGMRAIIELIEELVLAGGGWGLFTGCAAGDTGMAVVIEVGTAR